MLLRQPTSATFYNIKCFYHISTDLTAAAFPYNAPFPKNGEHENGEISEKPQNLVELYDSM
jgi:hypothetical protein